MEKREIKRISLDLPVDLAVEVKVRSARRNISMTLWIQRAIAKRIKEERRYE